MPKINQEEYEVLKALDSRAKSIVRQARGWLWVAEQPIMKDDKSWYVADGFDEKLEDDNLFQFIQWEDGEPYNIAELIKEYESSLIESTPWTPNPLDFESEDIGVKRDSEWMKEEFRKLERTGVIDSWVYRDLWMMANQLDEPEVLSQELPVIPQFVADWWERDDDSVTMYEGVRIEKKHKLDLVSYFQDRGLIDSLSKVEYWLDENDSIFLDLVNGKPYEVEKEKLYIVQLPTNLEDDLIILDADGDIWKDSWPSRYKMTEQRIKEIDERYWPFAVEVAE